MVYFSAHPRSNTIRTFFDAHHVVLDYGACCLIAPYLYFENPKTINLTQDEFTSEHWHMQPKGALNGQLGGIKLLLDVESFDFSYSGKESYGFRVVFSDVRDNPMVRQDAYLISPGWNFIFVVLYESTQFLFYYVIIILGQYTLVSLEPSIINTSENAMYRFIPEKRGCYTDKEFQLKTLKWEDGYRYSMNNCLYSSLLEKIFSNCSCIPAFIAQLINSTVDKPPCR